MSEAAINARAIRQFGRPVVNETAGTNLQALLAEGKPARFSLDADVQSGHVICPIGTTDRYLVADVQQHIGQQLVELYKFHNTGRITRCVDGAANSFGRSAGEEVTVAADLAVLVHWSDFLVSNTTDVAQGDHLHLDRIGESYVITAVSDGSAGLRRLVVEEIGP